MDNNWFSRPGDIEDNKSNINNFSFFKPAGSLEEQKVKEPFLKPAEDLEETKTNDNGSSYFQMAGDLDAPKLDNSFTFEE